MQLLRIGVTEMAMGCYADIAVCLCSVIIGNFAVFILGVCSFRSSESCFASVSKLLLIDTPGAP